MLCPSKYSGTEKNGMSVDSQIQALTDYCKENNFEIVNIYNDAGSSAHASFKKKPALLQLIKDCEAGIVDLIIFTKLDRWFRSLPDYYAVQEYLDKYKVPWKAIWEDYETETSSGKFKVNIMLSIAQAEAERTSERIKAVNEYRRAKGDFVGGIAPIGYININKGIAIDESMRECIDAFFKTYLQTYSVIESIKAAATFGVNISRPKALRILKSDVYAGNSHHFHRGCDFKKVIYESTLEKYLVKNLLDIIARSQADNDENAADNTAEIKLLESKLKRIGVRYEDGDISTEEYRSKRDSIKLEIAKLSAVHVKNEIIQLEDNWSEQYLKLDDLNKKAFWNRAVKSIIVNEDGSYSLEF